MLLLAALLLATATPDRVGQPVDIASSAYQYRADRKPDANPPESWFALMHFANLPLNKPVDPKNPVIRSALNALLWEEIRPVQTVQLIWPVSAKHVPPPSLVRISALINQGASSSWWNNLNSVVQEATPTTSGDGRTYTYDIGQNTCGLIVGVKGDNQYDVPKVRVLAPDTWKQMNLEIEWGFEPKTAAEDYSGRIETYDGRISNLQALNKETQASTNSWNSKAKTVSRRGVRLTLLYMGTSKWRKQQPYTTQADEVARTIVTLWTKSGNISFRASDLENGPIFAPEYGFFIRRTDSPQTALSTTQTVSYPKHALRLIPSPLGQRMSSIAGAIDLKGWGSDDTPWFGSNPTDQTVSVKGITFPPKCVAMHPGQDSDVLVEWRSPIKGRINLFGTLTHAQAGGNGIDWWVARDAPTGREILAHNSTNGAGSQQIPPFTLKVDPGDRIDLIVGPKGDHRGDSTLVDWTIGESGGQNRSWNLAKDVASTIQAANPHEDSLGNPSTWRFCQEMPTSIGTDAPSDPPIRQTSNAITARAFLRELAARHLKTIRERTRKHPEQTWEAAVAGTRGTNLPPHPAPPAGQEPPMQVEVPSKRLTDQWKLGAWHLLRHCGTNPATGRRWFNDYPYGILAAETYLVLSVLDQMGEHQAAADGFDQWLSLPLERDHPVGLFSDGQGALTFAVGPDGYGGHMDGIHAFGPGSIGWALTQHYWMSGDNEWLKASAPRMLANARWMLRQRQLLASAVPGGNRLWAKGLQPPMQVTPDSGGLWMDFYECEAYYWASISRLAETLSLPTLRAQAEAYRRDLRAAVERSIALSPVVPVRDGTYHSVIPFACYVRGLATGAWGWERSGSGAHVGPLYWDTVQTAAALISPAALLPASDVRVQGYLDVLEDRLLLENANVGNRDWFLAGWQYQGGLERTPNMHLAADDVPVFLRSFLNCYAVDILPNDGYVFNEHAVHGPPDKIFEEAAFLERFRNLLVMEEGQTLWLARGTPRAWLEQGKKISVKHAPTRFGDLDYEIISNVAHHKILATVTLPSRTPPTQINLRLRHPNDSPIKSVTVNGNPWKDFDRSKELVSLRGLTGTFAVEVSY